MSLSLLLLLFACSSQATHFYGTVMTYYPKQTSTSGSITVVLRYKLNFHTCTESDTWDCLNGDCGNESSLVLHLVFREMSEGWCQREGIMTRQLPSNAPFQLRLNGGNWIINIKNGIQAWRAVTLVELRNRSDTGRANRSPQTTILPAVRVPSNCQRDFNLLAFDPDGDEVKCRYGNTGQSECNPCTPPSVLNLSSSCSLSFSPTNSSDQGPYAVQVVMEDFPRQTITLNQTNGVQTTVTTNNALSKLPVQFVLKVDPVVPSCRGGLYLPKFLPPTPANRARLYAPVMQTLEISINAEANISTISELLFSGPYNINQTRLGAGQYTLRWTPSEDQDGESHPICFVAQAIYNSAKYHSDLRCVIVSVGNDPTINATIQPTTTPLTTTSTTSTTAISMTTLKNATEPPITNNTTPTTTIGMTTLKNATEPLITNNTTPTTTISMTTLKNATEPPPIPTSTTPTTTIGMTTLKNATEPLITNNTTPTTTISMTTLKNATEPPPIPTSTTPTTTISMTTLKNATEPLTTTSMTPTTTIHITNVQNATTTPLTTTTTSTTTTMQSTTTILSTTTSLTTTTTTTSTTPVNSTPAPEDTTTIMTTVTSPDDTTLSPTPVIDVFNQIVVGLRVRISSSSPLSDDDIRNSIQQFRDELVRQGLPPGVELRFVRRL